MEINGELAVARGTGFGEVGSGIMVIDFTVDRYIEGYEYWATSAVTNAGGGVVVASSQTGDPSPWFQFLSESPENVLEIEKITRDRNTNLNTFFETRISDSTLVVNVRTTGEAGYPLITGMTGSEIIYYATESRSSFTETTDKALLSRSGDVVGTNIVIDYPSGVASYDTRRTKVVVLNESSDRRQIRLMYENRLERE